MSVAHAESLGQVLMTARKSAREAVVCTHCGLGVARGLVVEGREEQFCCAGCRTAYAIIHSCGLDRYYELKQKAEEAGGAVSASARGYGEFDQDVFRGLYVCGVRGGVCSVEMVLQGVHCGACVWLVEKLPRLVAGVIEARLDFRRSLVRITWDDAKVQLSTVARTLDSIGYAPAPARNGRAREASGVEDRRHLVRIGIAGACAGNVMLLAVCLYAGLFQGMEREHAQYFRWVSMAITGVSLAWPGSVFFRSSWAAIKTRTAHLDVPITLALTVGAAWSVYTTIKGQGEIYFDSLSVLVFVLLCGRYVQHRQQRWSADAMELLFSLTPSVARRVEAGGGAAEVPIEAIREGDEVEVRAGETMPADGVVVRGRSGVDESLLTGESAARAVGEGDVVSAGSVAVSGELRVRVTGAGENTRVAKLMGIVEAASARRAPIVALANRLSAWFVIGMIGLAAVAAVVWVMIEPGRAVDQAVALLVVTCPCALGLATPLTLTVALGRASRQGLLIKGGDAVQRLASARTVLLDKTGTLTLGRMSLAEWVGDEQAKALVRTLERASSHVIAKALVRDLEAAGDEHEVTDVEQILGKGIRGVVNGRRVVVGSAGFVRGECDEIAVDGEDALAERWLTPVAIGVDGVIVAWAGMGDQVRDDAKNAVMMLKGMGMRVAILSGDDQRVVDRVARELGIDDARGRLSPEDKLEIVEREQRSSTRGGVIFVGDGVNDAAALAAAGVGVAVHGGAEASLQVADAYVSTPGVMGVVELVRGSRRTMRVIVRNLWASGAYNAMAVAGTLMGFVTPLLAALIMPMSSITVLTLALVSWTFGTAGWKGWKGVTVRRAQGKPTPYPLPLGGGKVREAGAI